MSDVAAVGAALHNGWAILVTVAAREGAPVVVDRRRAELADPDWPSQPYHHEATTLELAEAEELVREVRRAVAARTDAALGALVSEQDACDVAALALPEPRDVPDTLREILGSRAVYIADAEMYREALHTAAEERGLTVVGHERGGEIELAARELRCEPGEIDAWTAGWRKELGAPWQKDHRRAAASALGALAGRAGLLRPLGG